MIDPKQARAKGLRVQHAKTDADARRRKVAALKALAPQAVNSDGVVDEDGLRAWLGDETVVDANNRGYALNFAGKGLARAMADIPTEKELKVEPAQSKNFADTRNIAIRGDNIDALKLLKQNYEDKIKMIYIDPPYNTTSENFVYKDNFRKSDEDLVEDFEISEDMLDYLSNIYGTRSHSGWLSFMYPRLKLARDLLAYDGVIFISIDDNEQANLKIICDEIFGEENFAANVIWDKGNAQNDAKRIQKNHENILCYTKNTDTILYASKMKTQKVFNDENGSFVIGSGLVIGGSGGLLVSRPNLGYSIYLNEDTGDFIGVEDYDKELAKTSNDENLVYTDDKNLIANGYKKIIRPPKKGESLGCWTWNLEKFNSNKKYIHITDNFTLYKKKYIESDAEKHTSDIPVSPRSIIKESSGSGSKLINDLLGNAIFNNPKPIKLMNFMLEMCTSQDDIILDFFAGSGTTAHAVMQLNAEDGGNRKFILVQLDEEINKKKSREAHQFCVDNNFAPVISSIMLERLNRAGEKIKHGMPGKNGDLLAAKEKLDIGYKVFSMQQRPQMETDADNQLHLNLLRHTAQDALYNMIAASGKELHHAVKTVEPKLVYQVDEAYYVLGECKKDLTEIVDNPVYINGYADISANFWIKMECAEKENLTILY